MRSPGTRRRRSVARLMVSLAIVLGFAVVPSVSADTDEEKRRAFKAAASELASASAPPYLRDDGIEVWGAVVDAETGEPIRDVLLKISAGRIRAESPSDFTRLRQTRERRTVDGAFHFACRDCVSARLRFFASGYRSASVDVHALNPKIGAPPQPSSLEVRLEKAGERVDLRHITERLVASPTSEKRRIVVVERQRSHSLAPTKARRLAEKSSAPTPTVELVAELDDRGRLKSIPAQPAGAPTFTAAFLDFDDARGAAPSGFIVMPSQGRSGPQVMDDMRLAPADGYVPRLELEPGSNEATYFYVRLGELYGRGYVGPPTLEVTDDGPRLVAVLKLVLNPLGGRSLEGWD
ncbi:MAG: hypothetical protein AAGM22_22985 [Acidobacteriota bacterium]